MRVRIKGCPKSNETFAQNRSVANILPPTAAADDFLSPIIPILIILVSDAKIYLFHFNYCILFNKFTENITFLGSSSHLKFDLNLSHIKNNILRFDHF